jgi:hypothetical protein
MVVRRVDTHGIITTVAGIGEAGFSGDGGPGPQAALSSPYDIAIDVDRYLYISDSGNRRIRVVGPDGRIATLSTGPA